MSHIRVWLHTIVPTPTIMLLSIFIVLSFKKSLINCFTMKLIQKSMLIITL